MQQKFFAEPLGKFRINFKYKFAGDKHLCKQKRRSIGRECIKMKTDDKQVNLVTLQ